MTADPTKLVEVLNHFYKRVPGDWVCLKTNADTLRGAGIELTFEATVCNTILTLALALTLSLTATQTLNLTR